MSIQSLGLTTPQTVRKRRRLMIGSEGLTNSGKTEFIMSAPGPKVILAVDRSFDSALDNPNPPAARDEKDLFFDVVNIPNQAGGQPYEKTAVKFTQDDFIQYFRQLRGRLYQLLDEPELATIAIDGDSDFWELQVLSDFGKISQIHPLQYPMTDAAKRTIINRCWESGKIIIGTNKLKDVYEDVIDETTGLPKVDKSGKNVQRKVQGEYKRQGFRDQNYLWQLQIRHLYKPAEPIDVSGLSLAEKLRVKREGLTKTKPQWGLRIMKCKANPVLEGDELWGDVCNFRGLVEYVYPNVDPREWGFSE